MDPVSIVATLDPQSAPKRMSKMEQKPKGTKKCHVRFSIHETAPDVSDPKQNILLDLTPDPFQDHIFVHSGNT